MKLILKIVFWTGVSVDLLLLLAVGSGFKIYSLRDTLWDCLVLSLPLVYLVGSSVLFVRSKLVAWRWAALGLVVIAPAAVVWVVVANLPNMRVAR